MKKHTPGPWVVHQVPYDASTLGHFVTTKGGLTVCAITYQIEFAGVDGSIRLQNARLIAAAPALLEALKISLELLEKVNPFKGQEDLLEMVVTMNRDVIAKAEGDAA